MTSLVTAAFSGPRTTLRPPLNFAHPPSKNRVGGFSRPPSFCGPRSRPQRPQSHRFSRPTGTTIASGRTFWPSRDPIEETGDINLHLFCANASVNYSDVKGLWRIGKAFKVDDQGNYSGTVVCQPGDKLKDLAGLITGRSEDENVYGGIDLPPDRDRFGNKVEIDVAPLLMRLEDKIREGIVDMAKNNRIEFLAEARPFNWPDVHGEYNLFTFIIGARPNGEKSFAECRHTVQLLMTGGLLSVLRSGEWDRLGYSYRQHIDSPRGKLGALIRRFERKDNQLKPGDWGYVTGWENALPPWGGENFIYLGGGKTFAPGFVGHPTVADIISALKAAKTQKRPNNFGGLNTAIWFFDVSKIASDVFRFRNNRR